MNQPLVCPKCKQIQHTQQDQRYLRLFQFCLNCDRKDCQNKWLSVEEFERREKMLEDQIVI